VPTRTILVVLVGIVAGLSHGILAQSPSNRGIVEGRVTTRSTRQPIEDAIVTLTSDAGSRHQVTTSADGRFVVAGLSPDRYTVNVVRPGFFWPRRFGPSNLSLASVQTLKDINFQLVATSSIIGRILNNDGKPLTTESVVMAIKPQYDRGRRILSACNTPVGVQGARAVVDEQGRYRLFDIPPGEYYVAVVNRTCTIPPVYYPQVSDPADALPFVLDDGVNLAGIDIRIPKRELYSVRFTVSESSVSDTTIPLLYVVRQSRTGLQTVEINNRAEGLVKKITSDTYMVVGLAPGSYEISYSPDSLGREFGQVHVDIVNRDVDAGKLVVRPTSTIQGRVQASSGITLDQNLLGKLRIRVQPLEGPEFLRSLFFTLPMPLEKDGTFTLHDLAPRRYQFQVTGLPPDAYVASARYGGRNVLNGGLLVDGSSSGLLDVFLSSPGGTVAGVVQDAKGDVVADSDVALVQLPARGETVVPAMTTRADQYGRFSLRGVSPGEWTILAWEDVESGAYLNSEFVKGLERRAMKVKVDVGTDTNVNVRVLGKT
jgi:hypothetical protein